MRAGRVEQAFTVGPTDMLIPGDLAKVEEAIRRIGARLLVVDTVNDFLQCNTLGNQQVRRARASAPAPGRANQHLFEVVPDGSGNAFRLEWHGPCDFTIEDLDRKGGSALETASKYLSEALAAGPQEVNRLVEGLRVRQRLGKRHRFPDDHARSR